MRRVARAAVMAALAALAACNPQAPSNGSATPTPAATAAPNATVPPLNIIGEGTEKNPITIEGQTHYNRRQYLVTSLHSQVHQKGGYFAGTLYTVHATFFDRSGKKVTAQSPRALVDQGNKQQTITMVDGVVARTTDGHTLRCRELVYRLADETLHGDGDVVITGPNTKMTGNHFDSDTSFTNITMR